MAGTDQALRDHLVALLTEGGAHLTFEQAFTDLPEGFSVATRVGYFLIRNSTSGWLFDTSKGCIQYRRVPRIRSR